MKYKLRSVFLAIACGVLLALSYLPIRELRTNLPDGESYFFNNGQIGGGDFLVFYLAGKMFKNDRSNLYNLVAQQNYRAQELGSARLQLRGELPFVYPAPVAQFAALFSGLSFWQAYFAWIFITSLIGVIALALLAYELALTQKVCWPVVALTVSGFIPFSLNAVIGGQLASFGIAILSVTFLALNRGWMFFAGLVFSLSFYKPPLFAMLLAILLISSPLRFALGFSCGAALMTTWTLSLVGVSGVVAYLNVVSGYLYGREVMPGVSLPPGQGAGVFAVLVQILPSPLVAGGGLVLVSLLIVARLCTIATKLRSERAFPLWFATAACASLALSVQCIRYDLALLLVPFFIIWADGSSVLAKNRGILMMSTIAFYFEFLIRNERIAGGIYQVSSLLLILLVFKLLSVLPDLVAIDSNKE